MKFIRHKKLALTYRVRVWSLFVPVCCQALRQHCIKSWLCGANKDIYIFIYNRYKSNIICDGNEMMSVLINKSPERSLTFRANTQFKPWGSTLIHFSYSDSTSVRNKSEQPSTNPHHLTCTPCNTLSYFHFINNVLSAFNLWHSQTIEPSLDICVKCLL